VRSVYSLGRGTATISALVEQAARYGHDALALTDRNNLYGAVPFTQACRDRGVRPILGAEVDGPDGLAVLLVRDGEGHANLCRLLTARMLDPGFRLVPALAARAAGLHVLTADPRLLAALAPVVSRGSLWAELSAPRHGAGFSALLETAARLGVEPVATGEVNGVARDEHPLHATLTAIRENTLVGRLTAAGLAPREAYLKAPAAMTSVFRHRRTALANTRRIAESCTFALTRTRWIFPDPPLPPGETAASHLRARCRDGMVRRYGRFFLPAQRRLERELDVIDRLGFSPYFVVVGEIMRFAQSRGIPSVGRGSGAGAITAYLLGITNVDPLRYGLTFERFLHAKRPDCPDLDVDLCWVRRDDVIDHVYETYGRDRVAMISTHNTFQPRSAFREAAKAHGIANRLVDRLARWVPHAVDGSLTEAVRGTPAGAHVCAGDPPWPRILRDAGRLVGLPRHLGLHPGGIVISDRPLDGYVPLEEATKGIVCTQYEMRAIEAVGLVKIDLLGNRALSTIRETVELVEARHRTRIDPDAIPHADARTAAVLGSGDTLGVFQMESPAMRNLNRMLGTRDLATTIAAVALIRPGPAGSGMKERFVRRLRGEEPVAYPDPRLETTLRDTLGILLYEEDVMRVAAEVAGLSLEDGDVLRRAIAGTDAAERERLSAVFLDRARRRGYAEATARGIWKLLLQFGAFAFCKAHASGYGVLAWQAGWLKAHYPVEFAAALMNHHAGMYDKRTHLEDAKRHGVRVLLPDLNRSGDGFVPEGDGIRVGLDRVRGLSEASRRAILAARETRPFTGLEDLLVRALPPRPEAEALILAGALDFTRRTRPELLCALAAGYEPYRKRGRRGAGGGELFAAEPHAPWSTPALPEFSEAERLWLEWSVLDLCVGEHPMEVFRRHGTVPDGALSCRDAEARPRRRVRVAGVLAARRTVPTRNGTRMQFLTLEDETGLMECTLFPEAYARHRGRIRSLGPYLAEGRVEEQYGAPTLNVERIRPLAGPPSLSGLASRFRLSLDLADPDPAEPSLSPARIR
jgi:DNA-directed DNA polymerase III PolC